MTTSANGTGPALVWDGRERRGNGVIERRGAWRCAKCFTGDSFIVGQHSIGARIRKCSACGMMDRRTPDERRVNYANVLLRGDDVSGARGIIYGVATVVILAITVLGVLIGSGVLP